jgi:hypothetical protein
LAAVLVAGAVVLVVFATVLVTGATVLAAVLVAGAVVLVVFATVLVTGATVLAAVLVAGAVVLVVFATVLVTGATVLAAVLVAGAVVEEAVPITLERADDGLAAGALAVQTEPTANMLTAIAMRSLKRTQSTLIGLPLFQEPNLIFNLDVRRYLPISPISGNVTDAAPRARNPPRRDGAGWRMSRAARLGAPSHRSRLIS